MREPAREALLAHALAVVRVAAEDFVGAFAGQHHGHVPAREARQQHGRQRRLVGEGLVEHVDPAVEGVEHVVGRQHERMVAAADVRGHARRFAMLADRDAALEADVEGVDRRCA